MTNSFQDSGMPTGPPRLAPRRYSYASVVSGQAASSGVAASAAAAGGGGGGGGASGPTAAGGSSNSLRSGAFAHLLHNPTGFDYDSTYSHDASGRQSRGLTIDPSRSAGSYNSWSRPGQLPSFSSAFSLFMNGHGAYPGGGGNGVDGFFVPSYLKGCKHVQKLAEAHKQKLANPRDHSSQPGSLSTSSSSVNLHAKLAPSHRGMTYDLIEKAPPIDRDDLAPLPTKWNDKDKYGHLEVMADGLEVKYTGGKATTENEAFCIRADHPMPAQCGIYYFEVTIMSRRREDLTRRRSSIGIGFSGKKVDLSRLPGWEPESWAYHGDDGHSFCGQSAGKHYGPPFAAGDVIGCGVNFRTGSAFFTKNGDHMGTAFREVKGKLYPTVGMKKVDEHVRVNFGQSPFVYDIDEMMAGEKLRIKQEVESTSITKLSSLNETDLIQSLVLQFLAHEGYIETARAFAEEVQAERGALSLDKSAVLDGFDFVKEDADARNRQRIRAAILEGDIDKALKYTNAYYPNVLKDNEHVSFRLKCRKFIEMIRQGAELHASSKKSNGAQNGGTYDDEIENDMEIDEQPQDNWDKMETEDNYQFDYAQLLEETLNYGRMLQAEFKDDPRKEVKKALDEAFALFAYEDPMNAKEVAHLLQHSERVSVAEELNSAILVSLGKSSSAALERLYQQTSVLLDDLRDQGGSGAFVNIDEYVKP